MSTFYPLYHDSSDEDYDWGDYEHDPANGSFREKKNEPSDFASFANAFGTYLIIELPA
jgi:hypothetical protein